MDEKEGGWMCKEGRWTDGKWMEGRKMGGWAVTFLIPPFSESTDRHHFIGLYFITSKRIPFHKGRLSGDLHLMKSISTILQQHFSS